jgi:hypothetical protein
MAVDGDNNFGFPIPAVSTTGLTCLSVFGCDRGEFPICYLGIPIYCVLWKNNDRGMETSGGTDSKKDSVVRKENTCPSADDLVLINSVITSMVLYMLTVFLLPRGVL